MPIVRECEDLTAEVGISEDDAGGAAGSGELAVLNGFWGSWWLFSGAHIQGLLVAAEHVPCSIGDSQHLML